MTTLSERWRRGSGPALTIILLVAVFCALPQLFNHSIILGMDSIFHLNRFYEAAMQLQQHDLTYFQSNYAFQQSGRIVTALYGPYLTYAVGWLLLHLGSWLKLEIVLVFMIETVAGVGMFYLARQLRASRQAALAVALIFMLAGWVPAWITTQEFMAWGTALMPLVLARGVQMVQDHAHPVHVLGLALSMALLIQTHALSSLLVTLALVPCVIVGWWHADNRWRMVRHLALSVLIVLVLTANVWGALLEVYTSNHVMPPYMPLNSGTYTTKLGFGAYGRGTLGGSLGIICSGLFLAQILSLAVRQHRSLTNKLVTMTGTGFLLLASPLVPWNRLVTRWPVIGSYLQFPSRFAAVAAVLLLAGCAISLTDLGRYLKVHRSDQAHKVFRLIVMMALVVLGYQTYAAAEKSAEAWNKPKVLQSSKSITISAPDMQTVRESFMSPDLGLGLQMVAKGTPDYLPVPAESWQWFQDNSQYRLYHDQTVLMTTPETAQPGQIGAKIDKVQYKLYNQLLNEASPYAIYYDQITQANTRFKKRALPHGVLEVRWHAKRRGVTQVPVVAYAHSRVTLNGHQLSQRDFSRSDIGAIITTHQKGDNVLRIRYVPKWWMQRLLMMTPAAWLIVLAVLLTMSVRRFRKRNGH